MEKGVKQGCILSPLLFGLFINDLPSYLKGQFTGVRCGECDIGCLLYADDIALLSDSEENLQVALNLVYNWCCLWGVQISPKKSQIMHFRRRRRRISNYQFTCGNSPLSYAKECKYLGFWFNEHLDANMFISRVSVAAKKALGVLIAHSRNSGGFMFDVYTRLFNTVVMPIITYSAAVWGFKCYPSLQQIQNWAMRYLMGLGKVTPIAALQGDMGWAPVETNLKTEVLKCWHKLCNMDKVRLPKQIYRWMGGYLS